MKLLENVRLSEISNAIAENSTDCQLDFILESYSCKMVSTDKRVWRANGEIPEASVDLNPVPLSNSLNVTSFNHYEGKRLRHFSERSLSGSDNDATDENMANLANVISKKTLFNFNQALNAAYKDYDFNGKLKTSYEIASSFQKVKDVTDQFFGPVVDGYGRMQYDLWNIIEDEIKPNECVIYSYRSSSETDPFNEDGVLWSFNFLLYNRHLKRILVLACRALSTQSSDEDMDMDEWEE